MEKVDYENEQSIIAHLLRMEDIINNYQNDLKKETEKVRDVESYNIDADKKIDTLLEEIKKEMLARLQKIINECNANKEKIFADANKYKSELFHLYSENLEVAKKIEELQKQIKSMEIIIGHDRHINYTK